MLGWLVKNEKHNTEKEGRIEITFKLLSETQTHHMA